MEIGAQEPGPSPGPARSPSPRHKSKTAAPRRAPESGLRVGAPSRAPSRGIRVGAPSRAPRRGIRVGAPSRGSESYRAERRQKGPLCMARTRSGKARPRSEDRSGPGPLPLAGGAVSGKVGRLPARRQPAVLRVPHSLLRGRQWPPACAHLPEPRRRAACASRGVHRRRGAAARARAGAAPPPSCAGSDAGRAMTRMRAVPPHRIIPGPCSESRCQCALASRARAVLRRIRVKFRSP